MTILKLRKELAKREGLKKQVDIAQLSEVLGHLSDMIWEQAGPQEEHEIYWTLSYNGWKRAKKKAKKK